MFTSSRTADLSVSVSPHMFMSIIYMLAQHQTPQDNNQRAPDVHLSVIFRCYRSQSCGRDTHYKGKSDTCVIPWLRLQTWDTHDSKLLKELLVL